MKNNRISRSNSPGSVGDTVVIDGKNYFIVDTIAKGGYGVIYKAKDDNGKFVAIKVIHSIDENNFNSVYKEIEIQKKLSHCPYCVSLNGFEFVPALRKTMIVMEYCPKSLVDEMNGSINRGFSDQLIAEIFFSIASAVTFMHSLDPPITHRDLKIENVLYRDGQWKLCDFGSATDELIDPSQTSNLAFLAEEIKRATTPCYRAPEMVDLYRYDMIGPQSDIWALGCFLYKLCTFKDAFPEGQSLQILNGRVNFDVSPTINNKYREIIVECLKSKPNDRPTSSCLLNRIKADMGISTDISSRHSNDIDTYEILLLNAESTNDYQSDVSDIDMITEERTSMKPDLENEGFVFSDNDEEIVLSNQIIEENTVIQTNPQDLINIDELVGPTQNQTQYNVLFVTNRDELTQKLIQLEDYSLYHALDELCKEKEEAPEYILSIINNYGVIGSKIAKSLPPLPKSSFSDYFEFRKQFSIIFPQFEGNFSLTDFFKSNSSAPPPPGSPPLCTEALKLLQNGMDSLISIMRSFFSRVLIDESLSLYQIISYIIAKLILFNISTQFLQTVSIPLLKNQHRKLKNIFDSTKCGVSLPESTFDFTDREIITKIRSPPHKTPMTV